MAGSPSSQPAQTPSKNRSQVSCKQHARPLRFVVRLSQNVSKDKFIATIASLGGTVYRELPIIQAFAVSVPEKDFTRAHRLLAAIPGVLHLSLDGRVFQCDDFTTSHTGADLATATSSAGGFGLTGNKIGVAVIDSGIMEHPDFIDQVYGVRIVHAPSFASGNAGSVGDTLGHGTFVAGIIGGNGAASSSPSSNRRIVGVATRSTLVDVPVLDEHGTGYVSDVIAGINWAIDHHNELNIRVINLSLGHPVTESYQTDPLNQAVEAAWKAGIVVVCAAGNEGRVNPNPSDLDNGGYGTNYGSIQCPGNDPYVITVGATKSTDGTRGSDQIATYSSRGPSRIDLVLKPDIVAPGNRLISTRANNSVLVNRFGTTNDVPVSSYSSPVSSNQPSQYFTLSGTSMAAPVVAGAVALMVESDPSLSPDTVKARLMFSADKWTLPNGVPDVFTFGAGYLNIPAALSCNLVVNGVNAISPTVAFNSDGTITFDPKQTVQEGTQSIWGTGISNPQLIYGQQAIWGGGTGKLNYSPNTVQIGETTKQAIWGPGTSAAIDLSSVAIFGE
jgi:serine protease AprX